MRNEKKLCATFILCFILTACTGSATPTPPATIYQLHNWLTDKSCPQPCWQGIRQGVSTAKEALTLLNSLPEIQYIKDDTVEGVIYWGFDPEGKFLVGTVRYDLTNNMVINISYETQKSLAIYEVFEQIGEPSHIYIDMDTCHTEVCDYWYHVWLIYADQGISLNWGESHLKKGIEILGFTATQNMFEITFEEQSEAQRSTTDPYTQPWLGFKLRFKDYCNARGCYGFYYDPNPPPTLTPNPTTTPPVTISFVNHWLNHLEECPQPCWQGIRPGHSTITESLEILQTLPEVLFIQDDQKGTVWWDITPEDTTTVRGRVDYNEQAKVVDKISYQTYGSISLRQIFQTIGEPSHATFYVRDDCDLLGCPDTYTYEIALYYADRHLTLSWSGQVLGWGAEIPNFHAQVTNFEVLFSADYLPVTVNKKWQGFNNLQQYCSNYKIHYCRSFLEGPLVTPTP